MSVLTVVGFGLAILFLTVIGILANSLRHRSKEVVGLIDQVAEKVKEVEGMKSSIERDTLAFKDEIQKERAATASARLKSSILSEVQEELRQSRADLITLKSRLSNCYERDGKRFLKVGKV